MTKLKMAKRSLILMVIILVLSVSLIFVSSTVGQAKASAEISRRGGSMDGDSYNRIIDTTTDNFKTVGSILMLLSGCGVLLSGYGVYKELE